MPSNSRPTPWFWAVNGAAGVLAAGVAVTVSIHSGISTTLWCGAVCYLLLGPIAIHLATFRRKKPFLDDRATDLGARTRRQIAAGKV